MKLIKRKFIHNCTRINVNKFFQSISENKLKAFTIMELIVTLVISGLVVLAAFQVINSFSRFSVHSEITNETNTRALQFYKALRADMNHSESLLHYDDETIFQLPQKVTVSYKLNYNNIIRTVNNVSDTFDITISDWHLIKDKKTGLPTTLELEIVDNEKEISSFRITKEYDNAALFNTSELR